MEVRSWKLETLGAVQVGHFNLKAEMQQRPGLSPIRRPAVRWVPSLYFAEGLPFAIAMTFSVAMYQKLGLPVHDVSFYTSCLYLPWVIKPLWGPLVDTTRTKRAWTVSLQFAVAALLALTALLLPTNYFLPATLASLGLMAFASATHDIAADGLYLLGLTQHEQAWWVGIRSICYRAAVIVGGGQLVILAGKLEARGDERFAWSTALFAAAGTVLLLALWHWRNLPRPVTDVPVHAENNAPTAAGDFRSAFRSFFTKPGLGLALGFILCYRLDEAQLAKIITPFLLGARAAGGLGLDTTALGLVSGTGGVLALTGGGLLGGWLVARFGLRQILPGLVAAMYLPKLGYVLLAWLQPHSYAAITAAVVAEQFGYGLGFTAFMLYLVYFVDGPYRTAHYALATGFMALGMMVPGLWSGWLAEHLGYRWFFPWVMLSTVPGLTLAWRLRAKIDPHFGKK
jgi:PAT family beta-lactamase induction signal transducer AmpG